MKKILSGVLVLGLSVLLSSPAAAVDPGFDTYHGPAEVNALLRSWNREFPRFTKIIRIGKSEGGTDLLVFRMALPAAVDPDSRPGIFVSANLEGPHLVGTEAALMLIQKLLEGSGTAGDIKTLLEKRTVYVAPLLNPDAAQSYFSKVLWERRTNQAPVDDDVDGVADEDGPDDLNGDGLITMMRVKDPEGKWLPHPSEPRLMKKADPKKGEQGLYKMYIEGLDNDKDGKYNEDPPGGIELNRNFPHDFEYGVKSAGLWPVSARETIALLEFLTSRKNIAMVLNFSTENTILNLQQTGRAAAAGDRFKVPERFARFLGLDPEKEYTMQELIEILKGMNIGGGIEINESIVAMILGLGPAMTIDRQDMPFIEAVQKDYKDGLKKAKLEDLEKRAQGVGKGSFVAYSYFQYGVPVFSTDLWKVPEPEKEKPKEALTVEKLKTMSPEDFLALSDEVITAFLKDQGAPVNFKPDMVRKMVASGRITPEKMAEMIEKMPKKPVAEGGEHPEAYILHWIDSELQGKGFVDWTPFRHPDLGEVEIGGFAPFVKITPPPSEMKPTLEFHTDFYIDLMGRLPELNIKQAKVEALAENLYHVSVILTNEGWFPTSTAQGRRARTAWPIRVKIATSGKTTLFSGRNVETLPFIGGSGDTRKVEWIVRGKKGSKVTVTAASPRLGSVSATLVLE
ncbi:MAG: M14 family metallopeptidase [Candidatus Aminicenantales bacterium]